MRPPTERVDCSRASRTAGIPLASSAGCGIAVALTSTDGTAAAADRRRERTPDRTQPTTERATIGPTRDSALRPSQVTCVDSSSASRCSCLSSPAHAEKRRVIEPDSRKLTSILVPGGAFATVASPTAPRSARLRWSAACRLATVVHPITLEHSPRPRHPAGRPALHHGLGRTHLSPARARGHESRVSAVPSRTVRVQPLALQALGWTKALSCATRSSVLVP